MSVYTVRSGDTLGVLAARYRTTVAALAKANGIKNVNVIRVGQRLTIPGTAGKPSLPLPPAGLRRGSQGQAVRQLQSILVARKYMTQAQVNTGPGVFGPRTEAALKAFQQRARIPAHGRYDAATRAAMAKLLGAKPASGGGTTKPPSGGSTGGSVPLWNQGDPRWGGRRLGNSATIRSAGCAMTATAMAISKISGRTINPGQLDAYLDSHRGYSGDALMWNVAARARGLTAVSQGLSISAMDRQLARGRPVVIGVDFKPGSYGGANGTDHWVTVTGRYVKNGRVYYTINDSGNGSRHTLTLSGGRLVGTGGLGYYRTTNRLITFN